jgi:hypothetical protein
MAEPIRDQRGYIPPNFPIMMEALPAPGGIDAGYVPPSAPMPTMSTEKGYVPPPPPPPTRK